MDIYVDGNDILLGTFVKVKREFIKQYQSLIKTNTCDLTNVQWPRRKANKIPFWAFLAIIGLEIVVAGGVVLFIVKLKKKKLYAP
jgi:type IV secretory pathway component VirB8